MNRENQAPRPAKRRARPLKKLGGKHWSALIAPLLAPAAQAAPSPDTYTGLTGNWSDGSKWSLTVQPSSGAATTLSPVSGSVVVTFDIPSISLNPLTIDATNANFVTLAQSANSLTVNSYELVGSAGNGALNQSGGSHSVTGPLFFGVSAGSVGSLTLSNGSLGVSNDEVVGQAGIGTATQSGGTNTIGGALELGLSTGGSGTYTLTGGILNVNGVGAVVGNTGTGIFRQTGGTANVTSALYLGFGPGVTGTYSLTNGALLVYGDEFVGNYGLGALNQTGGRHVVVGALSVGAIAGGQGTATISGGTLSAANMYIGGTVGGTGGAGVFTLTNALVTVANTLKVWNTPGSGLFVSSGTMSMGSLDLSGNNSLLHWNGGTLRFTGTSGLSLSATNVLGATVNMPANAGLEVTNILSIPAGSSLTMPSGHVFAGTVANAGTITLISGLGTFSPVSGTGSLSIGGSGTSAVSVTSISQKAVTVSTGGKLTIGTDHTAAVPWGANGATITPGSSINVLTLTNGGSVAFSQTVGTGNPFLYPTFTGTFGTRLTHTVGTLVLPYATNGSAASFAKGGNGSGTITPQGTLDIGNHQVLLNTPTPADVQNVKMLVAAGYNASAFGNEDGAWDGKGITSSVAKSSYDPNALASKYVVAYAYGGDQSVQLEQGGGASGNNFGFDGLGTNQTLVRAVLLGDVNMDGAVDFNDIGQVLGFTYNQNKQSHYTDGDIANHGIVNFDDIGLVLAYNFNHGLNFPGQTEAQAQAKASVFKTTAAAVRKSATHAAAVAGKPDFTYDAASGDLKFVLNGFTPLQLNGAPSFVDAISITSANGLLVPGAASDTFSGGVGATLSTNLLAAALTNGPGFGDGLGTLTYDLGNVLPTGLSLLDVESDLTLRYQVMNDGLLQATGLSSAVPEPAGLAMIGLGAGGLLGRRKRSLKSQV